MGECPGPLAAGQKTPGRLIAKLGSSGVVPRGSCRRVKITGETNFFVRTNSKFRPRERCRAPTITRREFKLPSNPLAEVYEGRREHSQPNHRRRRLRGFTSPTKLAKYQAYSE